MKKIAEIKPPLPQSIAIANLPQENMTFTIRYVISLALCQKKDFKEIHFVKRDLKHFFKEK